MSDICACCAPQNSAHWPRKIPVLVGVMVMSVLRPGMRSSLPARLGTQKLWMTSLDWRLMCTGTPTGRGSSFAVRTIFDGSDELYWTSHHHWFAVMVTESFGSVAAFAIDRSATKLAMASAARPTPITAPQP